MTEEDIIKINHDKLPEVVSKYINDTILLAHSYGMRLNLPNKRSVLMGKVEVNGYVDGVGKEFACACSGSWKRWFPIFVHESCHLDQWREDAVIWKNHLIGEAGLDGSDLFELWIDHEIEFTHKQRDKIMGSVLDLEFDCEKRVVEKIKHYNLPIDIDDYIKEANAYVLFYNIVMKKRTWYEIGKEPYNIKELMDLVPDTFDHDPRKMSRTLERAFIEYCL